MATDRYTSPLSERYASKEMQYIFSQDKKFTTWRKLWIALAESEKELGLNITDEQIAELKEHQNDINYDVAKAREKEVRHDVMSHVYAYGVQCPKAKGIIHLGATSCYVGDNTDMIIMREGLQLVKKKLVNVIAELAKFADRYKALPTLAFTHFQPAQPTTVGKRATLWMMELVQDYEDICYVIDSLKLLGSKGTTGTQASFMELFDGDHAKIRKLDQMIADKMGFAGVYPVSGQTYSRKVDSRVLNVLAWTSRNLSPPKPPHILHILPTLLTLPQISSTSLNNSPIPHTSPHPSHISTINKFLHISTPHHIPPHQYSTPLLNLYPNPQHPPSSTTTLVSKNCINAFYRHKHINTIPFH